MEPTFVKDNVYPKEDVEGWVIMPESFTQIAYFGDKSNRILNLKTNNEIRVIFNQQTHPSLMLWDQSIFDKFITNEHFKFPDFQLKEPKLEVRLQLNYNSMYNVQFRANTKQMKKGSSISMYILMMNKNLIYI